MADDEIVEQPEEQEPKEPEAQPKKAKPVEQVGILEGMGRIKDREIVAEMQQSYLDYAMSVIVSRALPDVRDGLKPVHRRILYAMNNLGLKHSAKYRKSATVVGEVLGKFHPHGDTAVYDSMVRMAQDFSMRYQLVDGQGNFGSVDGDSAAAMRYTEARMSAISDEILSDLDKDTVNFVDNYDGTLKEPAVMPARIPNLLLNGTMGIAVGMATNIPPHNLSELVDGLVGLIDNPEITVEELMESIKGPDFPTGASIFNIEEIKQAYATGKGRVLMRATAEIVEEEKSGKFRIVITELPYQVNKAVLIEKIADLVQEKRIVGISDIRDESDRRGMSIVIELKRDAFPKKILNQLYKYTQMQDTFHINMLALVDGIQPKVLTLKNVLEQFVTHRQEVIVRRTKFELQKARDRAHILEGLKIALDHIDEVINTIRASKAREDAKTNLMEKFKLSDLQADAILEMKLSALAGLERKKVEEELKEKMELIAYLEGVLADSKKVLKIAKEELLEIKKKYGDERRTKIVASAAGKFTEEDLIPNEEVIVTLTTGNYIKRLPINTYQAQRRGGKGIIGMTTKEEDVVEHLVSCWSHDDILFFTDRGRVFQIKAYELPVASRQAKGQAAVNLIQLSPEEKVTSLIAIKKEKAKEVAKYMIMATRKGTIKKTPLEAYANVRKTGLITIKLDAGDSLKWVKMSQGHDNVIMVTEEGQAIQFAETDVRSMGRAARGVRGMRLRAGDFVMGMDVVPVIEGEGDRDLLVVTKKGLGKKTGLASYGTQKRGGIGVRTLKVTEKTGKVVSMSVVGSEVKDLVLISRSGQVIRLPFKSVPRIGRATQGVRLMRLADNDFVASVASLSEEEIGDETKVAEEGKPVVEKLAIEEEADTEAEEEAELEAEEIDDAGTDEEEN